MTFLFPLSLTTRRSLQRHVVRRRFSSSSCDNHHHDALSHQRVWNHAEEGEPQYWTESIIQTNGLDNLIGRIKLQERKGGRMKQRQLGVLSEDPVEDMRLLIQNYTGA